MLQWSRNSLSNPRGPACPERRLVSRSRRSRLTSPVAISTLTFSTITPPASPPEIPTPPGYSRPIRHQSKSGAFRSPPLLFPRSPPAAFPTPSAVNPSTRAASTVGWFPLIPHQIVPTVADYGLAQVPLRIQGIHGQQPQAGIVLEQPAQVAPATPPVRTASQQPATGPSTTSGHEPARSPSSGDSLGRPRTAWPTCRPPRRSVPAPSPHWPPSRSRLHATAHTRLPPGCVRWWWRGADDLAENPKAPSSAGQFILAKRAIWAMVV